MAVWAVVAVVALLIGFCFYAIKTLKAALGAVATVTAALVKEREISTRLSIDIIRFADQAARLKQSILYLENENAELTKKVVTADPGAAISDSLRRGQTGFKGP